jgi:hypothetical protein
MVFFSPDFFPRNPTFNPNVQRASGPLGRILVKNPNFVKSIDFLLLSLSLSLSSIISWVKYKSRKTKMMEESAGQDHDHDDDDMSESTDNNGGNGENGKLSDSQKNPPLQAEGIVKKGILSKKGRKKIFRPWVLRTIVLDNRNILSYFDGRTLKGTVNLHGTTTTPLPPDKADGRSYAFEVSHISKHGALQGSSLILAASSAGEAEEWVNAINSLTRKHDTSTSTFQYESLEVSFPILLSSLSL